MASLVVFGNAKNANMCRKDLDDNGGDTNPLGGSGRTSGIKKKKKKKKPAQIYRGCLLWSHTDNKLTENK